MANLDSSAMLARFPFSFLQHAWNLVGDGRKGKNVLVSPLSMQLSLFMLSASAKGNTREDIFRALQFDSTLDPHALMLHLREILLSEKEEPGFRMRLVNRCWLDSTMKINPSFSLLSETNYGSTLSNAGFSNEPEKFRLDINRLVEEWTEGKIKDILKDGSITNLTRFVLVNALYFKGTWIQKFDPQKTRDETFTDLDGNSFLVPFLHSSGRYHMKKENNFSVLKLPYASPNHNHGKPSISLYLVLPTDPLGLKDLIASLDSDFIQKAVSNIPQVKLSSISFPKFKFSFDLDAEACLKSMGMVDPFTGSADFSDLIEWNGEGAPPPLYLSHVMHQAFLEVDEEGSEGGASTAMVITLRGLFPPPLTFEAHHPFLFWVMEETSSAVLFIGAMVDPRQT